MAFTASVLLGAVFAVQYAVLPAPWDQSLFTPVGRLDALSVEQFTTLSHPAFPVYSVRIKRADPEAFHCDPTVKTYTGYIDVTGARHLFFYFFESRNDPGKDDVIFWTNGGPGCSSSLGLFMELGPCRVLSDDGPVFNPYSWNSNASMFFVDQPIGVGFSYADYDEMVSTTEEAAKDIAAFVAIFFQNFPDFQNRGFHMAGESYGGRYLPVFASEIYDQNVRLVEVGITPINLTSIMMGNGLTDWYRMVPTYVDMVCTSASLPPIASIGSCVAMKEAAPRCERWTKVACIDHFDALACTAATDFCNNQLVGPFDCNSKKCEGEPEDLCYPVTRYIREYLDDPEIRAALNVSPSLGKFNSCSNDVGAAFASMMDEYHPSDSYVAELLERGVRVLVYVGVYDWICNWIGNERWTLAMTWSGQEQFVKQPLTDWYVNGNVAGRTRSAAGLTYATVNEAGHMVPYDKPEEALEMVKRWLTGETL
ncbi:serine carboxypeptidase [Pisolithus marmoratus]|nr:serine carboxypeptidase [Pisolithus marmoratus]